MGSMSGLHEVFNGDLCGRYCFEHDHAKCMAVVKEMDHFKAIFSMILHLFFLFPNCVVDFVMDF